MSGIRSSNTAIELKARTMLKLFGFVYQPKGIYGRPDFANKGGKGSDIHRWLLLAWLPRALQ
jgi:G:T-mismatch repair DNA endonuclease (very short patch repair protein)